MDDELRAILEEQTKMLKAIRADVDSIQLAQVQMNLMMTGIKKMWDRLECNQPRKRPPSAELHAVGKED